MMVYVTRSAGRRLALGITLAAALGPALAASASASTWAKVDTHVHSVNVSGDAQQDLGVIAENGKRLGFDAMFITDHTASHVKEVGAVISNHLLLEDDIAQWTPKVFNAAAPPGGTPQAGSAPQSTTAVLATSPVKSGIRSLRLAASSPQYSESFVYTKRGASLHSGDVILRFSAYPTQIDPGSGMFVSVSIGGDETISGRPPFGFSAPDEVPYLGKHTVLIWQIGSPRAATADPQARMITHDLDYTINQWNTYEINVSQAIRDEVPAADQPHDMNALTQVKLAAAGHGGTADGYIDAVRLDATADLTQGQEFVRRNQIIDHWNTPDFKLFPSEEVGYNRHVNRFYFPITDPSQFTAFKTGISAIPDIQAQGYPVQLNHPGLPGGVSSADVIANRAYGAEVVETAERGEEGINRDVMTNNWDAVLNQGTTVMGTWSSDSHRPDKMGPATYLFAAGTSFDALMRTLFEGRSYNADADYVGRGIFNVDGSDEPAAARYPIIVSPDRPLGRVHLKITGGIPPGSRVVWVSDGEVVASDPVNETSLDAQRSFPLTGAFTYVRAELVSASGSRLLQTQPLFFRAGPSGLPAGMSYALTGVTTPSGTGYVNSSLRGITESSWAASSKTLQATLTNPSGSLAELRLKSAALAPTAISVDEQPAVEAASFAEYDAADGSAWWYDEAKRVLRLKALQSATAPTAAVTATFVDGVPEAPPPAPTSLTTTSVSSHGVSLRWTGNGGTTAGYGIYRNGALVQEVPLGVNEYSDQRLTPGTTYRYTVDAYNIAEGRSQPSDEIVRTTDTIVVQSIGPVADTYVELARPTSNYGRATSLRTDRDDDEVTQRTYLRFVVPDLGTDPISAVTLRMFGNSASNGQDIRPVTSNSWSETQTTWENRPPADDALLGSTPMTTAGVWISAELDTTAVSSGQTVGFAVDARSTAAVNIASRESANPPQLVIETQVRAKPTVDAVSISGASGKYIEFSPVVSDPNGDTLRCELVSAPSHGTATIESDCTTGRYRSETDFGGSDSFTYRAIDSSGAASSPATVTVAVNAAPSADDVDVAGPPGADLTFEPVVSDPGDTLTCALVTQPEHGTASVRSDCSGGTYRSEDDFYGSDTLRYRAVDSHGVASASAKVNVSISAAPTAADARLSGLSGAEIAFVPDVSDPEGDALTCELVAQPSNGTAVIERDCAGGTYRSDVGFGGDDSFSFRAVDSFGVASSPATVTVAVDGAPTAGSVEIDGITATEIPWTPAVSDPGEGELTCDIVTQPANGTATVQSDCTGGSYRSASGFAGSDSFSYRAVNASGVASASATVTVDVAPAILFSDDFETADLSRWTSTRNVSVSTANPRGGQHSLLADVTNGNAWTRHALGVTSNTTTTRLWLRVPSSSVASAFTFLRLRTAADQPIVGLGLSSLRKLQMRNDATATTTTGSASPLMLDTWNLIEFTVTTAGSAGSTLVRLNGATVGIISATNINLGSVPMGMLQLGEPSSGKTFTAQWDDVSVTAP